MPPYTWEEVLFNIDVKNEAYRESQQQQDIMDEQLAEETAMGWWSLGLSLVGGALFGPVGYVAGKMIGRHGADLAHDWEDMAVDEGKFYKSKAREFKETRDKAAKDQDSGQILNAVTDLATMYVMAGGLEEGFEGWGDLTTFGTGDDAWTAFGTADTTGVLRGVEGDQLSGLALPGEKVLPLARTLPGDQSLFSEGFKTAGSRLKNLYAADKGINTAGDLFTYWQDYQESEEEKGSGRTVSSVGRNIS